jgi:hypothetical protein
MGDWQRVIHNLVARFDGPLHFRLIVQPLVASMFAVIDGIRDGRMGNPAYFWAIAFHPADRKAMIQAGWKRVGKVFIFAVILDVVYQIKVNHWVYPGETLIVAFALAIVPYLVLRGPINRLVQMRKKQKDARAAKR